MTMRLVFVILRASTLIFSPPFNTPTSPHCAPSHWPAALIQSFAKSDSPTFLLSLSSHCNLPIYLLRGLMNQELNGACRGQGLILYICVTQDLISGGCTRIFSSSFWIYYYMLMDNTG